MQLRNISLLFTLSAAISTNSAYAAAQVTKEQNVSPRAISTSPFKIAQLINKKPRKGSEIAARYDLSPIWNDLGIDAGGYDNCAGVCKAKIFQHELDGQPGAEVIVRIRGPIELSRYLIFTRSKHAWRLLGFIDHDFNKYEVTRHRVSRFDGRNWLVIRGQEGSGSGYALYSETWYEVNDREVRPVLTYPVEGHTYAGTIGVGRRFKARRIGANANSMNVVLQYTARYTAFYYGADDSSRVFINTHLVRYDWNENSRKFVFDRTGSEISEAEINGIANIQSEEESDSQAKIGNTAFYSTAKAFAGGGYEVFLKYNSAALMKVATGHLTQPKEWLRRFLAECDDTTEKLNLLSLLNRKP